MSRSQSLTPDAAGQAARPGSEARSGTGPASPTLSRRRFIRLVGRGGAAVVVVGSGGVAWRAVDQGVFATGSGTAYAAWSALGAPDGTPLDLVRAAVLAASAHNTQPWIFRVAARRIDLFADPTRNIGTIDPLRRELQLSLGCALENLVVAGPASGWRVEVVPMPDPADPTHVARIDLEPAEAPPTPLSEAIAGRHTNRAAYDTTRPVSGEVLDAMANLVDDTRAQVVWFADADDRAAFGSLVVAATEAIIADPAQATDDYAWYRSSWQDIQERKDGVTSDAAGLSPLIGLLAKLLPSSQARNDASWLGSTRDSQVATAAAFGTLVVRDAADPVQLLAAGRAWQRIHLWATSTGLAMQPLNQVEERIDREATADLAATFTTAMTRMLPAGWTPVFSFRAGYPTQEAGLSPRRPAEDVVRQA